MAQGEISPGQYKGLWGTTRKAATSYAASQGAYMKTIMETGDWAQTSNMCDHYIRCLPEDAG